MPIDRNWLQWQWVPAAQFNIVLGMEKELVIKIGNLSERFTAYNLTLQISLPDGLELAGAAVPPAEQVIDQDYRQVVRWVNLKDLAPGEWEFSFSMQCRSLLQWRQNGGFIPFHSLLGDVLATLTVDTRPRGNQDVDNEKISLQAAIPVQVSRYDLELQVPGKMPRGAGNTAGLTARWPYQHQLIITNNAYMPSRVNIEHLLANGLRYLGELAVTGPDASALSTPVILPTIPPVQNQTALRWNGVTLSAGSTNRITFTTAIYDRFTVAGIENSGNKIPHATPLTSTVRMSGVGGEVTGQASTLAMDITLERTVHPHNIDVGEELKYTLLCRVNQYDHLENVTVFDIAEDGQEYLQGDAADLLLQPSADQPDTRQEWRVGALEAGNLWEREYRVRVRQTYLATDRPVLAGDVLVGRGEAVGVNATTSQPVSDRSSTGAAIAVPVVRKQLRSIYRKDGSIKNGNVLAPGDRVEFQIEYQAASLKAFQGNVTIEDFFPFFFSDLRTLQFTYSGYNASHTHPPLLTDPHGLSWYLGDVPGGSYWQALVQGTVPNPGEVLSQPNLLKLRGQNSRQISYSQRDQILLTIGQPDLQLNLQLLDPPDNNAAAGQEYTWQAVLQNLPGPTSTDAYNFTLQQELQGELELLPDSIDISGSATTGSVQIGEGRFSVPVFACASGQQLIVTYRVKVRPSAAAGAVYSTLIGITAPYAQPASQEPLEQYTGLTREIRGNINIDKVSITNLPLHNNRLVGDTLSCALLVKVPRGTNAYHLELENTLAGAELSWLAAHVNGLPAAGQWTENQIVLPLAGWAAAVEQDIIFNCRLDFRIIAAPLNPPAFLQAVENTARVFWHTGPAGGNRLSAVASNSINVLHPYPELTKQVRNISRPNQPAGQQSSAAYADIVEYVLQLRNTGRTTAASIVVHDDLPAGLVYLHSYPAGGRVAYQRSAHRLIWNLPDLPAGANSSLVYYLRRQQPVQAGRIVVNSCRVEEFFNQGEVAWRYGSLPAAVTHLTAQPGILVQPITGFIRADEVRVMMKRGSRCQVIFQLVNTGQGSDNYRLVISPVFAPYSVYLDGQLWQQVAAGTDLDSILPWPDGLPAGARATIHLWLEVPQNLPASTDCRFTLELSSLTPPRPGMKFTIIDP